MYMSNMKQMSELGTLRHDMKQMSELGVLRHVYVKYETNE